MKIPKALIGSNIDVATTTVKPHYRNLDQQVGLLNFRKRYIEKYWLYVAKDE